MERRFELRFDALMDECEVPPAVFQGMMTRLEEFVVPFAECLIREEQRAHAGIYCAGLLSDVARKNVESIAYRHDQQRKNLQNFIGSSPWDHEPLLTELARQVGQELGRDDAVLVFDPSAFPKKGADSVGVDRQWCGRLGKVENCQVGVYMGYVSGMEHTLLDVRLYLPKSWARDKQRREECHVPRELRYRTRPQLALDMLDARGDLLPHGWVTGDDELGRAAWFRRDLRDRNEQYLLAVPGTTTIRDLEAAPPAYDGFGGVPKSRFVQARHWCAGLDENAWTRVKVRDGEKGPLVVEIVTCRVQARDEKRNVGAEETLVVIRRTDETGKRIVDFYLSNAPIETRLKEFARVAKAHHRVEECIQRAKSEAGLADYEVRTYQGWYHHQTLSLIATWFLVQETRRGKKIHAGADGSASPRGSRPAPACGQRLRPSRSHRPRSHAATSPQPVRSAVPLASS